MKYCANCDRRFPQDAVRCPGCGLLLLELPDPPSAGRSDAQRPDAPSQSAQTAARAADRPRESAPAGDRVFREPVYAPSGELSAAAPAPREGGAFKGFFTAVGAAVGASLLLFVLCVLVFGVFRNELFGRNKTPMPAQPDAVSPSPVVVQVPEEISAPSAAPETGPSPASPASVRELEISAEDARSYRLLCETTWTEADRGVVLTFFEDNSFIYSSAGGDAIVRGDAAVSGGGLFLDYGDGKLRAFSFTAEDGELTLEDTESGERTVYRAAEPAGEEAPKNLFEYPVSVMDASSYNELVESGPWTDLETGWVLSFYFDNTYLADRPYSASLYGSALVSGGTLCMVRGSEYEDVYECSYSLSAGTLTITSGAESWSLLSNKAYQAMQLRQQLNTELYDKLVAGSCWYSRSDASITCIYFFSDHTYSVRYLDLFTDLEHVVREGQATVEQDTLYLSFGMNTLEYTVSVEDNLLYLTDASGGGTVTYESYKTFSY